MSRSTNNPADAKSQSQNQNHLSEKAFTKDIEESLTLLATINPDWEKRQKL